MTAPVARPAAGGYGDGSWQRKYGHTHLVDYTGPPPRRRRYTTLVVIATVLCPLCQKRLDMGLEESKLTILDCNAL